MHQEDDLTDLLATDLNQNFKHFVLAYQHSIYQLICRRSNSSVHDAEEITQEAFLRAYCALRNYPELRIRELRLYPWLERIALNVLYNRYRDHRIAAVSLMLPEQTQVLEQEDHEERPDDVVIQREQRQELETELALLPERYRTVIALHYFDELTYKEIAERLQQPIGTIKAKLHRGLSLLRKTFSNHSQ